MTLTGGQHPLNKIVFDRSGKVLVGTCDDGTIKVFARTQMTAMAVMLQTCVGTKMPSKQCALIRRVSLWLVVAVTARLEYGL